MKNEITCIYNKQEDEIDLLHDYSEDTKLMNQKKKNL